jgi:uncharacterized protein
LIKVQVIIDKSAIGICADFRVEFIAEMICARCLKVFKNTYTTSHFLTYIPGKDPNAAAEKVALSNSEVERLYFSGNNIDLSIGIKEAIILAVPITVLCDEQCRGLCPICGVNKNEKKCRCKTEDTGHFTPPEARPRTRKKRSRKK